MKINKLILILVAVFGATFMAQSQLPNYLPTNGLVGFWPMNGNANDVSGNGNHGNPSNVTWAIDRFGTNSSCANFNKNQRSVINVNCSNPNVFTWSVWCRPEINGGGNGPTWGSTVLSISSNCPYYWCYNELYQYQNQGDMRVMFGNQVHGWTERSWGISYSWQHIVYSYDGNILRIYVNGNQIVSSSMPGHTNSNCILFGDSFLSPGSRNFNGQIDDISLWNRVLTPQEITTLYNAPPPCALNVSISGNTTFCPGGNTVLTANGATTYAWSTGATTAAITVASGGTYTVTGTSAGGCTATAAVNATLVTEINATISPATLDLTPGSNAAFNATAAGAGITYRWQSNPSQVGWFDVPNNATYSGGQTNALTVSNVQLGNHQQPFRVIATVGNCADTSEVAFIQIHDTCTITVNDTVSVSVTDTLYLAAPLGGAGNTVRVFPNAAFDHLTIDYGNFALLNGYTLQITNALGQAVFSTPIAQQSDSLDLYTWGSYGTYTLSVLDPQQQPVASRVIVLQ